MLPDHIESNLSVYVARRTSRGKPEISSVDFAHYSERAILFEVGTILAPPEICQVFFFDGSVLSSRPTGFSVFSVSPWCNGFRRFYHHGATEKTENALIQSQVRHYFSDEVIFFALRSISLDLRGG